MSAAVAETTERLALDLCRHSPRGGELGADRELVSRPCRCMHIQRGPKAHCTGKPLGRCWPQPKDLVIFAPAAACMRVNARILQNRAAAVWKQDSAMRGPRTLRDCTQAGENVAMTRRTLQRISFGFCLVSSTSS